jgi:hypothetical protein
MTFPGRDMRQGSFTAGILGTATSIPTTVNVNLGFIPTKVELINMTAIANMTAATPPVNSTAFYYIYRAVWQQEFASFTTPFTLVEGLTPSAATSSVSHILTNGISSYNGQITPPTSNQFSLSLGPIIAGTNTATATGTFTITSTATLFPGATILMTKNTVNKQLGGMYFTVATVPSATTFTIANAGWLAAGSFTNGAETFNVQLVATPPYYYPQLATIVSISQANPAVVTTSVNLNLQPGEVVRLRVPNAFGMTQANNITGIVSASAANQITLGGTTGAFTLNNSINTSAFTAFTWPLATGVPFNYATVTPIGSGPTINATAIYNYDMLDDAQANTSFQGFTVGSLILNTATATVFGIVAGDVLAWTAWRADQ